MQGKALLASRTFWGGFMLLLSFILAKFNVDFTPSEQEDLIDKVIQVVEAIGAIFGPIFVLWGRYAATKSITGVVRSGSNAWIVLVLPSLLLLGGCSVTPSKQWAQAREGLTTGQNVVLSLHAQGKISDQELIALDVAVQSARAALAQAETYLPEGGKSFVSYMEIVQAVLNKLAELEAQAQQKGSPHALHGSSWYDRTGYGGGERHHRSSAALARQERNHGGTTGRDQTSCWHQRSELGHASRGSESASRDWLIAA